MSKPEPSERTPRGSMQLAGLGLELAATLAGACLLGYWIDYQFETDPWGLLICAIVGIVGGLYNVLRRSVHDMIRRTDRQDHDRRGGAEDGKGS